MSLALKGRALVVAACLAGCALLAPVRADGFGLIKSFGPVGSGAGQMSVSLGMAVGPEGLVYLSDYTNYRVDVFTPGGTFVRAFGKNVNPNGSGVCSTDSGCQAGSNDASAGALATPTGVAVAPDGTVYVAEFKYHRINVFSAFGSFIRAFGKNVNPAGGNVCTAATGCREGTLDASAGGFYSPTGLEIGPDGLLYVADYGNNRIQVFTLDGTFVRAFGKSVNPSGANTCTAATGCVAGQPAETAGSVAYGYDLAVAPNGQIAVGSGVNARVDVFANDGTFIRAFGVGVNPAEPTKAAVCTAVTGCKKGTESSLAGGLYFPTGMAIDSQGDLVVADIRLNRVNEFTFDGTFIRAFGEGVIDGGSGLQVCTAGTGCRAGVSSSNPNSLPFPYSATIDCKGAIYVSTLGSGAGYIQIKRFGETTTEAPPCPPPPPGNGGTDSSGSSSSSASDGGTGQAPKAQKPKTSKPKLTIELNKGSGTASLVAVMPEAGTLQLRGKGIRKAKKSTKNAGLLELLIVPTKKVKAKLEDDGKAKVKVIVGFLPVQGEPNAQAKSVTLKMARLFWG